MTNKGAPAVSSSATRRIFVLAQTKPCLEILATSGDRAWLERERDALLAVPWDQDCDGSRELMIASAIHLPAPSSDRRRLQRRNSFR